MLKILRSCLLNYTWWIEREYVSFMAILAVKAGLEVLSFSSWPLKMKNHIASWKLSNDLFWAYPLLISIVRVQFLQINLGEK